MSHIQRISVDEMMAEIARTVARRSTCTRRAAVGAVLVNDANRVVATGYNGSPAAAPHCDDVGCLLDADGHCVRAVHAELNAIIQCAQDGVSTVGLAVYCTHSPCPRCAAALVQAGIVEVTYLEPYRDFDVSREIFAAGSVVVSMYGEQT